MVNDDIPVQDGKIENHERCIYIWSVPANGHMNPTLCLTNQLLSKMDEIKIDKIVFYCGEAFRDQILKLPNNTNHQIEFRDYRLGEHTGTENFLKAIMNFDTKPGSLFRAFKCFENSIQLGNKYLFKHLLKDIHRDRPVLVLYDQALFFVKFAMTLYEKWYKCPKPLNVCYVTTFMCAAGIYPTWSQLQDMGLMGGNSTIYNKLKNVCVTLHDFIRYLYTFYKTLWWDNGFTLLEIITKSYRPFNRYHITDNSLNLVFVLPELQPQLHEFQAPNIKFVGPCVDESVRSKLSNSKPDMDKYVKVIEAFLNRNLVNGQSHTFLASESSNLMRSDSNGDNFKKNYKPIIYVSMGTVFNNENKHLFQVLVEACTFYSNDYSIIISTGDESTYEKYSQSTSENILFVPHTPQVEILKRAHLFITHAGMNSMSEAMQYGVPTICIPLSGDQPFVAWRADELGIGIRLSADDTLTIDRVKNAISKILTDSSYRERAYDYALISKQYCGYKTAVEQVIDFVDKNEDESSALGNNNRVNNRVSKKQKSKTQLTESKGTQEGSRFSSTTSLLKKFTTQSSTASSSSGDNPRF